ncbi:MAG TPA: hypothetical protein VEI07_11325 [Planctomycetaceae bacterium]|nr:hypothetical protein [Planctomycetaceae bacterium]
MAFDFEDDDFQGVDETVQVAHDGDSEYEAGSDGPLEYYTEEQFRARGVDPVRPTTAKPGSEAKVLMLAARYAAGLPLWHDRDCYDHGPHVESQS